MLGRLNIFNMFSLMSVGLLQPHSNHKLSICIFELPKNTITTGIFRVVFREAIFSEGVERLPEERG